MLIADLFIQQPRHRSRSCGKWSKKLWYIPTVEYYLVMKKKKILPWVTVCVGVEGVMLREIIHTKKERYLVISLVRGI